MTNLYNIGYTGGTWDLFHIGHLNLLKTCKQYCKKLIVGVSSDELVSSYKKPPIISLVNRMEMVRPFADEVVIQYTLDKYVMWERLLFDVVFIGDDWKGKDEWNNYEFKLKNKAKVIYLPRTPLISSSEIKVKIYETRKTQSVGND
jgi:glycerol-3-phosphate cytidylyltransferase